MKTGRVVADGSAAERGGDKLKGVEHGRTRNGSRPGQNTALSGLLARVRSIADRCNARGVGQTRKVWKEDKGWQAKHAHRTKTQLLKGPRRHTFDI